jgi:hypothetical protein
MQSNATTRAIDHEDARAAAESVIGTAQNELYASDRSCECRQSALRL